MNTAVSKEKTETGEIPKAAKHSGEVQENMQVGEIMLNVECKKKKRNAAEDESKYVCFKAERTARRVKKRCTEMFMNCVMTSERTKGG